MKKTMFRSILRDIRKSFGRFIAIIAIVALGVGFLTGLLSTTPDMKVSVDQYYDNWNAADIIIKGTGGITDADMKAVQAVEGIEHVIPLYVEDKILNIHQEKAVTRIHYLQLQDTDPSINRLELLEGRLPEQMNECVVERSGSYINPIAIGSIIEDGEISYKVVGIVSNSWYFSKEKEPTTVGNGRLSAIIYLDSAYHTHDINTDLYITVAGAKKLNCFSAAYNKMITQVSSALTALGVAQSDLREATIRQEIITTMTAQIRDSLIENHVPEAQHEQIIANELQKREPEITAQLAAMAIQWYVLDRNANVSFASFLMNADKVGDIALIFPVFFFAVAALVALTTMTRMVEEERTAIGTLKALGYTKPKIMSKYLIYATLASGIGSIIGVLCGFALLPSLLYNVYNSTYHLPPFIVVYNWEYATISVLAIMVCILLVTFLVCIFTLKEKPSQLMQVKAPKPGKRILLERVKFIWSKIKFKYKSTIRNIFRYKKHFIMTTIGVAGCTALLLAGLGIKNSISDIANTQYDEILNYNLIIHVRDSNMIMDELEQLPKKGYTKVFSETGHVEDKTSLPVTIVVPENVEQFYDYVNLRTMRGKKSIAFGDESVIISEQIAKKYKLKLGDSISLTNNRLETATFAITGITENYVGNYVYVSETQYQEKFSTPLAYQTIFVQSLIESAEAQDQIANTLLANKNIITIEFVSQTRASYELLFDNINFIVIVLVVSAGALAIIVIYNLTNININERKREIATLKVLGYHSQEVAGYVYRESILLTMFGIIVGLLFGIVLHYFIIINAESDGIFFGRSISWVSYVVSAVLTMIFSLIVDLVMYPKLKKIHMVESLKSNE